MSTQKFLNKRWDTATFGSVEKTIEYHVGKHGKGLNPIEHTQRVMKAFEDTGATRAATKDLLNRDAIKVKSEVGTGLFTPTGKIIWFHPNL